MPFKNVICVLLCLIPLLVLGQTEEDFQAKYTEVFMNLTDTPKAKNLAQEALDMVENTESLQTIGNYTILSTIFKTQLGDDEKGEYCQKKANALISFDFPAVDNNATYQSASIEWASKYTMGLYSESDPGFGREALKFLNDHPELHRYNNYSNVAYFFERIGDLKKARSLYQKARQYMDVGENEFLILQNEANFYYKSGEYLEAEKLIALNDQLTREANSYLKNSYVSYGHLMKMFYYLNIGDYYNYAIESDKAFDYLGSTVTDPYGTDPYLPMRYLNKALGNEVLRNYDLSRDYWQKYDSTRLAYLKKIKETYPQYPDNHLYMADEYLAKINALDDRTLAIRRTDDYYTKRATQMSVKSIQADNQKASRYGFLRDNRYNDWYPDIIKRNSAIMDFTEATRPNTYYAYFLMRDKRFEKAKNQYNQLWKENYKWINNIIFTFGEKAFVSFYNTKLKDGYDNFHSFVKLSLDKSFSDKTNYVKQGYDNLLFTKSIAFKGIRKRKKAFLSSNSPETIALYEKWQEKKKELIQLYQLSQADDQQLQQFANPEGGSTQQATKVEISQDTLELKQREVNDLENKLAAQAKGFKETLQIDQPKWQSVKDKLKPGEATIEMVRFYQRDQVYYSDTAYYAAYIVTAEAKDPFVIYLPSLADFLENRQYRVYQNSIRLKINDKTSYDQFWKPIKDKLPNTKKVYFSPDGIYHLINLPSLMNPETNQFLIDEMEVQYVTSTADLSASSKKGDLSEAILVGRPTYSLAKAGVTAEALNARALAKDFRNADISDLPGTEDEVKSITEQLQNEGVTVKQLIGVKATEDEMYEVDGPDILHIATHGFWSGMENATPGYRMFNAMINSGLLLAGVVDYYTANEIKLGNDGILTAFEAQEMDLEGTDLVILSACETGLGDFDAGEGVYGLQRAFRAAGSESIMTSLWKVDDQGTKDFMIAFYKNWIQLKDKHEAFRQTQLEMKEKYGDPYYWGAFILTGR